MKHLEAKELLKNRVEWQKPLDSGFDYLSFGEPESGRYLQEEHPSIKISIIYKTIVDVNITEEAFQSKLNEIKEIAIIQMLHDIFSDQKEISNSWINDNITLFDYAIILKVTQSVLFNIINTARTNEIETITKTQVNKWFMDLNGIKDSDNGVFISGYGSRYKREIERIRKVLFIRKTSLKVYTAR